MTPDYQNPTIAVFGIVPLVHRGLNYYSYRLSLLTGTVEIVPEIKGGVLCWKLNSSEPFSHHFRTQDEALHYGIEHLLDRAGRFGGATKKKKVTAKSRK